jgi:DNA-binding response OmpR family regulator
MPGIVIIEDEGDLADLYRMALEGAGYRVLGTFDDPGIPLLHPPPQLDPDVIILDERLKGLSGMAFMPDLRRVFPKARILLASADPEAIEIAVARCADFAQKKPFPMMELIRLVASLLSSQAPAKRCQEAAG